MKLAPVIVFAYNRPDHLRKTLDALAKNDLAAQSELYIYCDGAKLDATDAQRNAIDETRAVAHAQQWAQMTHVVEREKNYGLAENIVGAVTEIVIKYGRVIVFEDDIVCTRGTLTYLNDALELYQDEEKVMHISAYMYPHRQKLPTTFFYDSPYPAGGWATWARAWKHYNGNTRELVDYWSHDWKSFNIMGQDFLSKQLIMNLDGRLKTWYIKWYASMHQTGGLCLYPGQSMSNNIGWDDTGETSIFTNRYTNAVLAEYTEVKRGPIVRSHTAYRIVRVWYSGHWYSKRYRIKCYNAIRKCFGLKPIS